VRNLCSGLYLCGDANASCQRRCYWHIFVSKGAQSRLGKIPITAFSVSYRAWDIGKDMAYIKDTGRLLSYCIPLALLLIEMKLTARSGYTAIEVIEFVKSKRSKRTGLPIEIRFSSEDSFRSDLVDLLTLYSAVNKVGVNRVGIADTVGW
jgi:hypothetical protein